MTRATGCTTRVLLYARTSTSDGRQNLENQFQKLREEAAARGWTIVEESSDEISGRSRKRPPGLSRAYTLAAQRKIDLVAVFSLSRLTRNGPMYTFLLIHELNRLGCRVVSVTEPLFDGPAELQEMLISVAAYIAAEEVRIMSERVNAGLARKKATGTWKPGPPRRTFDRERFFELHAEGWTLQQLADTFEISKSTASRTIRERRAETRAQKVVPNS